MLIDSNENEESSKEKITNLANSYSIEVKNLKKHFKGNRGMEDIKAVDGISFHVESGFEFVCTYDNIKLFRKRK
jgi:ABC-type glutathione transport system ATPase component